jgi:uncharacterized protein GlcG (DUF336 family)
MRLPHVVAEILAGAAESEASSMAVPMAIAVVDAEGGLVLFKRMDGTLPASTELAVSKAYTAAVLRMPTHEVGELAQPGAMLCGIQQTHNGRIILFGGGYPLCIQGQVVGAIGVSGGTVEQDMLVGLPAVDLLRDIQYWAQELKDVLPPGARGSIALPGVKEKVLRAFAGLSSSLPKGTAAAVTGGVLLALA